MHHVRNEGVCRHLEEASVYLKIEDEQIAMTVNDRCKPRI